MMESYARQSDLDKLTTQVDRLVENLNNLLVKKEIHEIEQSVLSSKLDRIEAMLEKSIKDADDRISILEKTEEERRAFKKIMRKAIAWGSAIIAAVSTMHFTGLIKFLLS